MNKRSYDNTRRERKSRQTRAAIVKAMVDAMGAGEDDVSVAGIAERSGVSLRTVYLHFPDKASRVRAISEWVEQRVDMSGVLPRGFEDVPGYVERLVDYVLDNEAVIRTQMMPGLSKSVRSFRKQAHAGSLRRALRERISAAEDVERLVALIISTVRAEAILDLRDIYGQSRDQIKRAMRRMIELVIADAETADSDGGTNRRGQG